MKKAGGANPPAFCRFRRSPAEQTGEEALLLFGLRRGGGRRRLRSRRSGVGLGRFDRLGRRGGGDRRGRRGRSRNRSGGDGGLGRLDRLGDGFRSSGGLGGYSLLWGGGLGGRFRSGRFRSGGFCSGLGRSLGRNGLRGRGFGGGGFRSGLRRSLYSRFGGGFRSDLGRGGFGRGLRFCSGLGRRSARLCRRFRLGSGRRRFRRRRFRLRRCFSHGYPDP